MGSISGKDKPKHKDSFSSFEKRKVMELFVENDETLSHLLEFISNKFIEAP